MYIFFGTPVCNARPQLFEIWALSVYLFQVIMPCNLWEEVKISGNKKRGWGRIRKREDAWYRKKWFSKAGIQPGTLPSRGSLGAQETETPFWGDLQNDSHPQQTFPRCTAENCKKNTKTLLFKAEFQEPNSHSLLCKCPPACRHTIKGRVVEIHSLCFYSC